MKKLSEKSYTRVTLALDIIRKMQSGPYSGFHELAVIKHKIDLYDIITIEESSQMRILCNDPSVPKDGANICWKVCDLLKNTFGITANVAVSIEKRIPVKGGLAGGSANAATMFVLLNDLWKLNLDRSKMIGLSRQAGMDVPFFLSGDTALDTEAGGTIFPISTSVHLDAILVVPDFGVSTAEAYRGIDSSLLGKNRAGTLAMKESLVRNDRNAVIADLHNDFELSVFKQYPALFLIKKRLLDAGCIGAVMSGSGSCVIGILDSQRDYEKIKSKIGLKTLLVSSKPSEMKKTGLPAGKALDPRNESFRWHSKQDLCDYFETHYGLSKWLIDTEINEAMKSFRLRKGQAIKTPELWQKVGLTIERKIKGLQP